MKYFMSLFLLILCIGNTNAAVIYSYTGNSYNEVFGDYLTTMNITGSLILDTKLQSNLVNTEVMVNEFSFSDGINNINSNMETLSNATFSFSTNSSGEIVDWAIYLFNTPFPMISVGDYNNGIETFGSNQYDSAWVYECKTLGVNGGVCPEYLDLDNVGRSYNTPGTWDVQTVPIPMSIWLFLSGGITLISLGRKFKH
ncbi:hypothetical protein MNBD_GAMMA08-1684 [hydrothermal vent metagenome]|uniref:Uncharacterized protein n=1 Tax=hydrothermal vent metagenome TaxID=652676 RepID=A0A3B0XS15_9ZZZZ